jgi:hypothetical protein
MARAALHRKIDDNPEIVWDEFGAMEKRTDALKRLKAANDTVAETHALLPYGRGNVKEDNIRTGYESSLRDESFLSFFKPTPLTKSSHLRGAAAWRFVKAARCAGSAVIATSLHGRKLVSPYHVSNQGDPKADHAWAEVRWGNERRHDDIMIDRWLDGSAVLREDARYGYQRDAKELFRLDTVTGPAAARTVDEITASLERDPRNTEELNAILAGLKDYRREKREYEARRVFSADFEKAAARALRGKDGRGQMLLDIQAVGVALSLNGGPAVPEPRGNHPAGPAASGKVREALEQAPGILAAAKSWFPPRNP